MSTIEYGSIIANTIPALNLRDGINHIQIVRLVFVFQNDVGTVSVSGFDYIIARNFFRLVVVLAIRIFEDFITVNIGLLTKSLVVAFHIEVPTLRDIELKTDNKMLGRLKRIVHFLLYRCASGFDTSV